MTTISMLITGSEITEGRVQDTNAHFVARELFEQGISLQNFLACNDRLESIQRCLGFLLEESDQIIISGGIGPTNDDCTREAVSEFTKRKLQLDQPTLVHMESLYLKRQRVMDESNKKQALFPEGAQIIQNPKGTAAGFSLKFNYHNHEREVFILPGVPFEFRAMFAASVLPVLLAANQNIAPLNKQLLRIFGVPESTVGEKINQCQFPSELDVSYRAHFPEIQLVLKTTQSEQTLMQYVTRAEQALGAEYIFSRDEEIGIEEAVHTLLIERNATIAVAESCTAGMIGALLTATPGSSHYFLGGILAYSNQVKTKELQVPATLLEQPGVNFGAVCRQTAQRMAEGVRQRFTSQIGLSITGISGPDGGSPEKPVGTFFVGLASETHSAAYHFFFPGDRARTRKYEAYTALEVLRRFLLAIPVREHTSLQ